ncbi:pectate lyase [Bacteroides sp. 214]|nr:DUF6298 domain-containing protein [Bacteroides sp. 214]NDW12254.1 pectate lyase [Bacteroides sp. 214]
MVCVSLLSIAPLTAQNFPLKVENDKLVYQCDERGNRILDFSQCGYMNSNQAIPEVPFMLFVSPVKGDNSVRIQQAIDYVASLPLNKEGVRGAVLLDKGVFELEQNLHITASGVLLMGTNKDETVLLKKGFDRSALIRIEGTMNATMLDTLAVSSPYVPVNSTTLQLTQTNNIANGARVFIVRPSTKEWIASLNCDVFGGGIGAMGWKPGEMDLCWDRTVTEVKAGSITIDAPLTVALDVAYGGAKVILYQWSGRIAHSGVANLTLVSDYDKDYPKHEDHCWTGISIEHAENCWIQQVNFKHFAGSAVVLQPTASRVTVEDCISLEPISEIGGMRRTTFLTYGQLNLFQRCYSEQGIHDFAVGYCAAGPNAFVQCESYESFGFSGAVSSWSCGILFDVVNIDGNNLCFKNLGQDNNGAGWNTANSLFWQCTAAEIECYSPADDARNRAYGCWAQFSGNGDWGSSNNHVRPRSLFYAQLQERLGKDVTDRARILPMSTNASTSPSVETAMKLAQEAKTPLLTLNKWINEHTLTIAHPARLKSVDELKVKKTKLVNTNKKHVQLQNGKLTYDGMLLKGGKQDIAIWNGKLRTPLIANAAPHLSRFVPGREGKGLTDRIDSVITYMQRKNILVLDHNYGLWYDRRRDDHERIRRRDGYAWAPFYEQPFARTNSEKPAWDGMSKYDLTKYNPWYWARLKEFADKSEQVGLLLFHQNYFQHNILEAGAHWVDSPWRTANNVNNTGFPEPVHFAGDKRIFYAEMFYDVTHPVRRELHRSYIRKCLDSFADNHNVIQLISDEFTGPLHFVEFWIDVIAEWQAETGKDALVALSTTKDVQDAILNDPKRAEIVDIIDIRYWHYRSDGTVYAPEGGKNLAPRQHARVMNVGRVTFAEAYKAVSEYRTKYPDKAVTYYTQNYPAMAWAVLMAGGSCPMLPVRDEQFLRSVAQMELVKSDTETYQKLVKSGIGCIIYSHSSGNIPVELDGGKYMLKHINPVTGVVDIVSKSLNIKDKYLLEVPVGKTGVYWFSKL